MMNPKMKAEEALFLFNNMEFAEKYQGKDEYTEVTLVIKQALEKQIPKKPIRANRIIKKNGDFFLNDDNEYWKCPICTKFDVPLLKNQEYCHCCGQAIDWSDTEC